MNGSTYFGDMPPGKGVLPRSARSIGKTLVAAACALSLAVIGCSDGKKSVPKVVTNPDPVKPGTVISALDSLVKANKGTGKGVVTGFLSGEGKSIAKGLLKQASNAAGERRLLTRTEIPLTGATVLIFNAEKPTTVADTTLKTDTAGNYTCALAEGKYFGFAVYLDLETFQLVTTQIPNMNPIKDTIIRMDTAVAIEDVTAPTVVGVYDAAASNSDGVFLVGSVPATNAKINITFSEPMNRESAKSVVLGRVDTSASSTSLTLKDTVTTTMSWSGDSKELTLTAPTLTVGVQYGIVIPVSLKDLAKNNLESQYKATFAPVAAADIEAVAFDVAATFPADKGSLKPIQNPGISFNRPVDVFSVVKGATISPAVTGFWEVTGARAVFVHKAPLEVGKTYTVSLPIEVKDLSGKAIPKAFSYSFTVVDYEGAAKDATGANQLIALAVESMFDAYLSGDLGRFSAAFHANFRMFEGTTIRSKTQFLEQMKADMGERITMKAGFPAPVFDNDSAACKENIQRWKVGATGDATTYLWVQSFVQPGSVPRVWGSDKVEIDRAKIAWDRTGPRFTYNGKVYGFAPDFSMFGGGINLEASRDNGRFMADIMMKTSTIILEPVKLEMTESFQVDGGMVTTGDTARLAVKMSSSEKFSRSNFDPGRSCQAGAATHQKLEILKFLLVNDGTRWLVLSIIAPEGEIRAEDFNKAVDVTQNFGGSTAAPISLVAPVNGKNNAAVDGSVKFEFNGVKHDSVGGYLVGIAEDGKFTGGRPPSGALLFVKASSKTGGLETFTLDATGKVTAGNASAVLRRVQDLRLPGWERTFFEYTITKLYDAAGGIAGVYQWKVIAVKDTSAAQFLANGFMPNRFYGESDFGPARGYFAVMAFPQGTAFESFNNQVYVPPVNGGSVGFGDMDQDGVPDFMEQKYGSDMRDRNSYPDFRVDTDGDKMCDFLELKLDPTGKDSLVTKVADAATLASQKAALGKLVPAILYEDSDSDGFPDDVEQMLGFNPRDPMSNPGTKMRANAPVGVFAGKVQMGSSTHTVSFKLYQDSTKNLLVAFTAYFGTDTVVDSSRAFFNETMGEVQMALPLPKHGPDSGKALLLRGRYEAIQSLVMGPVDIILAPATKTTVNFGGGPYVGQFAASGRGEDVSRYLPGTGGGTGPIITNPINNPPMTMGYRPPPTGTSEGSKVVIAGTKMILINDFGDTLAVFPMVNWRSQPDGGFELFAEVKTEINLGMKRSEVGGRVSLVGDGWVIDGHFFQSQDSAGVHKDIPGQLCAKAAKADLKPLTGSPGLEGTLGGWIAQDKNGGGFVGPIGPTCPAGQICPNPDGSTCPAGQICPPVNSFSRPFMGGRAKFGQALGYDNIKEGGTFHVSMNGHVLVGTYDSVHVTNAKAPWCGNVLLKLTPVSLPDTANDFQKAEYEKQKMFLASMPANNLIIVIEDQFMPQVPARIEKSRDYLGNIVVNAYVAEPRPTPPDYGMVTWQCPTDGGIVTNPCPAGQICNPPLGGTPSLYRGSLDEVKRALDLAANTVFFKRDPTSMGEKLSIELTSLKQDSLKKVVICNPMGQPSMLLVFLASDSMGNVLRLNNTFPEVTLFMTGGGTVDTTVHAGGPLFLQMEVSSIQAGLAATQNKVQAVRDSAGKLLDIGVFDMDPLSLRKDDSLKGIVGNVVGKPDDKFVFLADGSVTNALTRNGMAVVMQLRPMGGGTICPAGQTCPPADSTKPVVYKGTLENLTATLSKHNWMAKLMQPPPALPVDAEIDAGSVKFDGMVYIASEVGSPTRVYVFMGQRDNQTLLMVDATGTPIVTLKPMIAGNP